MYYVHSGPRHGEPVPNTGNSVSDTGSPVPNVGYHFTSCIWFSMLDIVTFRLLCVHHYFPCSARVRPLLTGHLCRTVRACIHLLLFVTSLCPLLSCVRPMHTLAMQSSAHIHSSFVIKFHQLLLYHLIPLYVLFLNA